MDPRVDDYINRTEQWHDELILLRSLVLQTGLNETYKWQAPCYTHQSKNILMMASFKEYCVLSFFKGSLMKDDKKVFVKAGEHSRHIRMMRFQSLEEIRKQESTIHQYIMEAIHVEELGLKVEQADPKELHKPQELIDKLNSDTQFKRAFESLTPGRQRAYIIFFSGAKQSATRINRIEKYTQRILDGKGMDDCVCGLSKRMPSCDGSHKQLKEA